MLFKRLYVGIVLYNDKTEICVKTVHKGVVSQQSKSFLSFDGALGQDAISFIEDLQESYTYTYTATLLDSINQGGLPDCDRAQYEEIHIKLSQIQKVCAPEGWSLYAGHSDIDEIFKHFAVVGGVDYLFSPVTLLYHHYYDERSDRPILYLLARERLATIAVFCGHKLYYTASYPFTASGDESGQELGDTHEQELFGGALHEEFGGISIEELEVDLDHDVIVKEREVQSYPAMQIDDRTLELLLKVEDFLKRSIEEYYGHKVYQGDFVERVVVIDEVGIGPMLKKYIEEELLIETGLDGFDIPATLADLAQTETES